MTSVGVSNSRARRAGTSVPRCTIRTSRAPSARQRSATPPEWAITIRAAESARVTAGRPSGPSCGDPVHVAAVHRDDERDVEAGAQDGVAGGRRVVGVDEVEREARRSARSASASGGAA